MKKLLIVFIPILLFISCDISDIELPIHTLTFNSNGGSGAMESLALKEEERIVLPQNAFNSPNSNSEFTGWNTKADGTGIKYIDKDNFTMGTENVILFAQWKKYKNTIVFNSNNGSGTMDTLAIKEGETINLPENTFTAPSSSLIFIGWNTKADGTGTEYKNKASFTMGNQDITLFAQWQGSKYIIAFDPNSGTGSMSALELKEGEQINLPENTFIAPGTNHIFTGWNLKADGTGTEYNDKASFTMGSENITLYAQWEENKYLVSFDSNGGTGVMETLVFERGNKVTLPGNSFKAGSTNLFFNGWNTVKDGSGLSYVDKASFTMGTDSITLYAQWKTKTYSITFNSNGGLGYMENITVEVGKTLTLPKMAYKPATDGLSFITWNTSPDGSGKSFADMTQITMQSENIALHAIWKDIRFITKWDVQYNRVRFPLIKSNDPETDYDFTIDWGDGTIEHITSTDNNGESYYIEHNYVNNGIYTITVKGKCKGFGYSFNNLGYYCLIDVLRWGPVQFHNQGYVFDNCDGLTTFSATDAPDLSNTTSIRGMFQAADNFNGDLSKWDLSNIQDISDMFYRALKFNSDISGWNTQNITNMRGLFKQARDFNIDISSWNTTNVENMSTMFRGASSFNKNISGWVTSKVKDMSYMFGYLVTPSAFNQDISGWDTSSVTDMRHMFYKNPNFNCGNIDVSTWNWNVSNVTDMTEIFTGSPLESNTPGWVK